MTARDCAVAVPARHDSAKNDRNPTIPGDDARGWEYEWRVKILCELTWDGVGKFQIALPPWEVGGGRNAWREDSGWREESATKQRCTRLHFARGAPGVLNRSCAPSRAARPSTITPRHQYCRRVARCARCDAPHISVDERNDPPPPHHLSRALCPCAQHVRIHGVDTHYDGAWTPDHDTRLVHVDHLRRSVRFRMNKTVVHMSKRMGAFRSGAPFNVFIVDGTSDKTRECETASTSLYMSRRRRSKSTPARVYDDEAHLLLSEFPNLGSFQPM